MALFKSSHKSVILVLALVVCGLVFALGSLGRIQRATLADGTEFTLQGVTFGKMHRYVDGGLAGRWRAWLARTLKPLRLGVTAPREANFTTANDAVTFWFRVRLPKSVTPPWWDFYVLEDQNIAIGRISSRRLSLSPTDEVVSVTFDSFPRRRREIIVEMPAPSAGAPARSLPVRFHAPNRLARRYPAWQPSPTPIVVEDRRISFQLQRLVTGVSLTGNGNRALTPGHAATLAEFRVSENGVVSTNWQPVRIEASDAAGDSPRFVARPLLPTERGFTMVFADALWAGEPAWKLRVEFSRAAGFTPEELWVTSIPDVAAAIQAGTANGRLVSKKTFDSGLTVSVLGLLPRGQPEVSCQLRIRVAPEPRDLRLTLVAVTDPAERDGRLIPSELYASTSGNGQADYDYNLLDVRDAKSLNLTLALHQSRFVEFMAKAEPVK